MPSVARERALVAALLLCPTAMVVDPVVAAATRTPYSFGERAISDLAVTTCDADLCSPWWPLMAVAFVVSGLAMATSGVLLGGTEVGRRAPSVLLVVAGACTVGVGLVPLDLSTGVHQAFATPIFPAQNLALLLLAGPVVAWGRWWRPVLLVAAVVGLAAAVALVVPGDVPFGAFERVSAYLAPASLAALGVGRVVVGLRDRREGGRVPETRP